MSRHYRSRNYLWGIVLIIIGLLFLLQNAGLLDIHDVLHRYWPVILILLGFRLLIRRRESQSENVGSGTTSVSSGEKTSENYSFRQATGETYNSVFGDVRLSFDKKDVNRFFVNNVFGDVNLNFSNSHFADGSVVRVNGVFGNVYLRLPETISVQLRVNYLAGSSYIFEDRQSGIFKNISYSSPPSSGRQAMVRLEISIVFGDIRVSN